MKPSNTFNPDNKPESDRKKNAKFLTHEDKSSQLSIANIIRREKDF